MLTRLQKRDEKRRDKAAARLDRKREEAKSREERDVSQPPQDRPLFPQGYAIAMLEGERRPTPGEVRRIMAQRAGWLLKQINRRGLIGEPCTFYFAELAAIAMLIEVFDDFARGCPNCNGTT